MDAPGSDSGITYLDGARLSRGLNAGIRRVIADQDHLNRINVFPVPDGDTGTNLAMTMQAVERALTGHGERHAGRTLEKVADAALDGARGNSGAILAQFFHGLGDACGPYPQLTTEHFIQAVDRGAAYARAALSEPREGTILTVLSSFAAELARVRHAGHDFAALLEAGLERARAALADTTRQLEVLRRAGVVDAGAAGFVDLLAGVTEYMRNGSLRDEDIEPVGGEVHDEDWAPVADADDTWRYCTECMVGGPDIDRRALKESLQDLGGSLVVAGTCGKLRLHMHLDEPERMFAIARGFGEVTAEKVDDMQRQQDTKGRAAGTVAVVTDSAGDIPDEILERLNIHMVPVRVHFGERSYLDKISLTPEAFYAELESNPQHPKTSQPAPGDFRRMYQFLGSHHRAVISIHVSGKVSGTFQAAESAAARARSGVPVIAVDSRNAALGQGLVAIHAAELARAGQGPDEIMAGLAEAIAKTRTFALLENIRYAVRGGRVPAWRKVLADMLRLDPILMTFPDGRISAGGYLWGRRRRLERFADFVARQARPGRRYHLAVGHARDPGGATRLLEALQARIPDLATSWTTEIGTALGVHGGPGTLLASFQEVLPVAPRGSPPTDP